MTKHVIIVGSGPAGLTAAVYCANAGFDVTVYTGDDLGGSIAKTPEITNWPGIKSISGFDLMDNMVAQCEDLGVVFQFDSIKSFDDDFVYLEDSSVRYDALILVMGCAPNKVPGIEDAHYCATCDGFLYKGKEVVVIGGGDSAFTQARYLAGICKKVTIAVRSKIKAKQVLVNNLPDNIEIVYGNSIMNSEGTLAIGTTIVKYDGIFVAAGTKYINYESMYTGENPKCIMIAGDLAEEPKYHQAIIAAADGAKAAIDITEYLLTRS